MPEEEKVDLSNISSYDVAIALKKKIKKYGGGIKGVWDAIDPRLKYDAQQSQEEVNFTKAQKTIKEYAFRKQVERLDNGNLKNDKMTFGIKGNIILLLHVLDILEIHTLSDLLKNTSFEKPTLKHYIIDTNIKVKKSIKKLNKIYTNLQMMQEKKHRFTVAKIVTDWLQFLDAIRVLLNTYEGKKTEDSTISDTINSIRFGWIESFVKNQTTQDLRFSTLLGNLLNDYRKYFYRDTLLHKFHEFINKYRPGNDNKLLYASPLYAIYFLISMNRRFLYSVSSKNDKINRFDFIYDDNIIDKNLLLNKTLEQYIF